MNQFDKFWGSTENKVGLQQFFISWVVSNYDGDIPVYLGGCHIDSKDFCYKVVKREVINALRLKCHYDEADDRIMFHVNDDVKLDNFEVVHVVSGDTDVFVSLMYHYLTWKRLGLQQICVHHIGNVSPVHEAVENLSDVVVCILPAVHALSGCDTSSKVGTKVQAFKAAQKSEHRSFITFGIAPLDEDMFLAA